ncbi:DUF1350 family protein [Cyanobium sp. N.Huapi 1H5]|uniref:DUF1350 family protein n=1 Tax=Cyanobium sp. N.Huapi 1H5 TaxID=2823719 RepID=UPI0020CBE7E2|nr:DUF1350 family protein [Cyanobium sp. N.Huapi 1H5]MCP9837448.1 DUF1350 family protein [Cyanobium sp. N.Huapi 1H5]
MAPAFRFRPISHSWIAIHPEPKGVIQFMGGAFFGSFPTVFYRYLLRRLFEEGYTIIALPFRFSFRHWDIAIGLLKEQDVLRKELSTITGNAFYQEQSNFFWLGHSLGCKYIALLECLSGDQGRQAVEPCTEKQVSQHIAAALDNAGLNDASILSQPSLLLAPDISDTESAIPIKAFARFLDDVGLGVKPTRGQTQCLIQRSQLFNLTAVISFDNDTIAGSAVKPCTGAKDQEESDVFWLLQVLRGRHYPLLTDELPGKHLEPLGVKIGNYLVDLNPFDKFIKSLTGRKLEAEAATFLSQLRQRQHGLGEPTDTHPSPLASPSPGSLTPSSKLTARADQAQSDSRV